MVVCNARLLDGAHNIGIVRFVGLNFSLFMPSSHFGGCPSDFFLNSRPERVLTDIAGNTNQLFQVPRYWSRELLLFLHHYFLQSAYSNATSLQVMSF